MALKKQDIVNRVMRGLLVQNVVQSQIYAIYVKARMFLIQIDNAQFLALLKLKGVILAKMKILVAFANMDIIKIQAQNVQNAAFQIVHIANKV